MIFELNYYSGACPFIWDCGKSFDGQIDLIFFSAFLASFFANPMLASPAAIPTTNGDG